VVNNYVRVNCIRLDGVMVARVVVQPRRRLASVRDGTGHVAYLRRGNRTDKLEPWEIEETVLRRAEVREAL
jgi:hypothetical protein